jgi:hypothetical protein
MHVQKNIKLNHTYVPKYMTSYNNVILFVYKR